VNPDLRILIALQDIDQKIVTLQKQITEVPTKIQSFQQTAERLRKAQQDTIGQGQELSKLRRAHEGEVELKRTKLAKLKDQLMAVKTNKEYTAMLHEIQGAEDHIRLDEDKILEIMEKLESLEGSLKASEKGLTSELAGLDQNIRLLESSVPFMEEEMAKLRSEKTLTEQRVEAVLLSRYRQIAQARKGIALAEARDELCSACHVRIRPQVYADLLRTEDIFACDSCNRILFLRETL
jgi:predicted  nucleic acid-binding Zn-ribbon protein